MALQAFTLVPVNPKSLMEITPKNWHRYPVPPPTGTLIPAFVRTITYYGGAFGDDQAVSTANSTIDFTPRTQVAKAAAPNMTPGTAIGTVVTRARGYIAPKDPYPIASTPAQVAPTITSLSPNTAVTGVGKATVAVTITGTGFTQWSTVTSGNYPIPVRYLTPTTLEIIQKPSDSVPGTVAVVVIDHGVSSAPSNFVFT